MDSASTLGWAAIHSLGNLPVNPPADTLIGTMEPTYHENADAPRRILAANRWLLTISNWFIAALPLAFMGIGELRTTTGVAAALVAAVSALAGSVNVQTRPDLRFEKCPLEREICLGGLVTHGVAATVAFGAILVFPRSLLPLIAFSILYCVIVTAYLPFLRHGVWWSLAFIGATAISFVALVDVHLGVGLLFFGLAALFATAWAKWLGRSIIETQRARYLEGQLQLSEERLRIAHDLHDTMGQHLAAMAIKSQLAQALARRNDPRLQVELEELTQLAQTAAADMRDVVNQYRAPDLEAEVAGAQRVLTGAGVTVDVTGSTVNVPAQIRETAAWFIRETATNVLRHSRATHVTITFSPTDVTVSNNRPQVNANASSPGKGLDGLQQRAARHGARVHLDEEADRFTASLVFSPARIEEFA